MKTILLLTAFLFLFVACQKQEKESTYALQKTEFEGLKVGDRFDINYYYLLDLDISYADENMTQYRHSSVRGWTLWYHKIDVDNKTDKVIRIRDYRKGG